MARRREDIVIHRRRNSRHHRNKSRNYVDHNGYKRGKPKHSDLIHRQIAYKQIYLKNKKDYPLSFSEYQVHHIDENKKNNHVSNLQIVTSNEHKKIIRYVLENSHDNCMDILNKFLLSQNNRIVFINTWA